MQHTDLAPRPRIHPILYTLLIVPFGATGGFVGVALGFLATKSGLSVTQGASLVAVSMFPNVWKFFWAPVGDKTLTRRRWYVLSALACAAGMFGMAVVPLTEANLPLLAAIVGATSVAGTFLAFAVEGLLAHHTAPEDRGRTSGWYQAGNLGGSGLGGALGLWLLQTLPAPWMAGLILAVLTLLCCVPAFLLPDVPADARVGSVLAEVRHVARELWDTLRSREGLLCGVLCFVPVGTGAAASVLTQASVAGLWGAGEHEVELVQGALTGVVSMAGCLAGGWLCARGLKPRTAYVVFGGAMALVTLAMALSPMTVASYVGYSLAYSFVTGFCYAAFSGFVLDAIGTGSAATKYNGFASLSNTPIWYMGLVLAAVQESHGARAMLVTESAFGVAGIALFLVLAWLVGRRARAAADGLAPV